MITATDDDKPWASPAECYYDGEFESAFSDLEEEETSEDSSPNSTHYSMEGDKQATQTDSSSAELTVTLQPESPEISLSVSPPSSELVTPKTSRFVL